MADITSFLSIPYPSEKQDPFYDTYVSQMQSIDQILFMQKIMNNLFVAGGGSINFVPSTGLLTWTSEFVVPVFYYGKKISIPYGPDEVLPSAIINDGYALVVEVPYVLKDNVTASMRVMSQLTTLSHNQWVFAWRYGTKIFFKGMSPIGT